VEALTITDDLGRKIDLGPRPRRVVSLSPAATEIILALGAGQALKGISTEDNHFPGLIGLTVVGSPQYASPALIAGLEPDLLIIEPALANEAQTIAGQARVLVLGGPTSLERSEQRILELGDLFGRTKEARALRDENNAYFETLALKTAKLKVPKVRVMRITARDGRLSTLGSESFQNNLIRLAGGLTPDLGGGVEEVPLTEQDISSFDPELIFACSRDQQALDVLLARKAMRRVSAVKNHRVRYYPCALTDRAAAHTGYFAAWLSSALYPMEYGDPANLARPNMIVGEKELKLKIPYVARARVVQARLNDYIQKTLLIDFTSPQTVISTSDGPKEGVITVGNGSSPPMVWDINHSGGWESDLAERFRLLGLNQGTSSLIFTGADLDNLAVVVKSYRDMTVTALVTAGAESNAVRTSRDIGAYYEPGTINIIVLSTRKISKAGAAKAMISITEAKTAALWDLDVRSSQTPLVNPATGTGTDSIIIVAGGDGPAIDYTGGHGKIGQIIGEAVYEAVMKALAAGNGLATNRHVFARLAERSLDLTSLFTGPESAVLTSKNGWRKDLVLTLLEPRYAGLLESAMALDDARIMGRLPDRIAFLAMAQAAANDLAGQPVRIMDLSRADLPELLKAALDAIGSGLSPGPPL
jgi:adenosylcobinamide amidohydrolase/ABC-type Fe3+-hydroxamate transport system substrate-binding protein